jgi:hypothetical protein
MNGLVLGSILACAAQEPKAPPARLAEAVKASRSQPGYQTTFKSTLAVPQSAPLEYRGEATWAAPGVLSVQYTATGGDHKRIVRAGDKAWVWHSLVEDWVTAEEAGMAAAGKGIQNPDEMLAVLGERAADAKAGADGKLVLALSGDALQDIMKGQKGAFAWKQSSATVGVRLDADGRVKELAVDATLVDPGVKGEIKYEGTVTVAGYGRPAPMQFVDEKKKPIELSKDVRGAVEQVLKEKR